MKLLLFLTVLASTFSAPMALAKVSVRNTKPIQIPQAPSNSWTSNDVALVIPTDMSGSEDPSVVASRIGDHAIQSWFNSPNVKNSSVGRTANTVQEAMKTEVVIGNNDPSNEGTNHKFTFQVLALQALSQLKYTGWLNAALDFNARSNETKFEISEKLFGDKDLVLSHTSSTFEGLSSLGVRWSW